jgi:hypothetical protein
MHGTAQRSREWPTSLCEQLARREAIGITSPIVPLSEIDLADATALSVVHVNRTISLLRNLRVLAKGRNFIQVADRKQLARIARFDGRYIQMSRLVSTWAVQIEQARAVGSAPYQGATGDVIQPRQ